MGNYTDLGSSAGTEASGGRWGSEGEPSVIAPEIAGYDIHDPLGSGSLGTVWSARCLARNQLRAIKVFSNEVAESPGFLERFAQEAKALGRLEHPYIVKVYEANAEHQPPYVAMEWVDGESLSQILAKQPVPKSIAVAWLMEVAEALDYAHRMGFAHRDVKPSNVIVSREDRAMLADFGVAGLLDLSNSAYLAPEVCEGKPATCAGDMWSLAVLMYLLMAGRLPFEGETEEAHRKKIVSEIPVPPKELGYRLRRFLVYALEKDPAKRYKSAVRMIQDLKRITNPLATNGQRESRLIGSLALVGGGAALLAAAIGILVNTTLSNRQHEILPTKFTRVAQGSAAQHLSPAQPNAVSNSVAAAGTNDTDAGWFDNAGAGYTLSLPPGWTSSDASNESQQIMDYSPPGSSDVVLRVISEPLAQDGTIDSLFASRESFFEGQGGYERLSFNEHATLAGLDAVSWEFVQQGAASNSHCLAFGVLRPSGSITVESWCPTDQESTWSPVFDKIRDSFVLSE